MLGNIFVIGNTQTGKTTYAKWLADSKGYDHITASDWIPTNIKRDANNSNCRSSFLTEWTFNELKTDPYAAYKGISRILPDTAFVIDGIRNPVDFVKLFDFSRDSVVFIHREGYNEKGMDYGVAVIRDIVITAEKQFGFNRYTEEYMNDNSLAVLRKRSI